MFENHEAPPPHADPDAVWRPDSARADGDDTGEPPWTRQSAWPRDDEPAPRRDPGKGDELWRSWKGFCLVLGAGAVAVFLYQMVALFSSLGDFEDGMERGALLAMLLMIFITLGVVAVVGGGLARAIRRDRRRLEAAEGRASGAAGQESSGPDSAG